MDSTSERRAMVNYEGQLIPIEAAHCSNCDNSFFFVGLPEFQPKLCCYCGLAFKFYVDHEGVRREMSGLPAEDE
jgi:hypothetical protein